MSGSDTSKVLSACTTAAGACVLPNTNGNTLLTVFSIAAISLGVITLASFAASRVATKFLR